MFNLRLCNAATIWHSLLKFGHMHLCDMGYNKYVSPHCCKCNSFGCIATIRCGNACHGPHSDNVYSGSEHRQFNSSRLIKREAGLRNPRRALIGSNQLWHANDSPYYRELAGIRSFSDWLGLPQVQWIMGSHDQWEFLPFSPFYQRPLTVLLHSPNGRHLPAIRAVQGHCDTV